MSAQYILEYGGCPCRFGFAQGHTMELVAEADAAVFASAKDAWWAAYQAGLNPDRCRVVNLAERYPLEKL